ncbi:MAG: dephospho-CoA kinase [Comamonas sp.]|jgi:dephospho-CoA kinase|uniref:dephospho-CoA kinase n=1 Tax=Comamonas sp. TaxID=34028 RepID=UPI00281DC3AA|nr:dephospho-CoA kinase [Comamonas sp.]MDR0213617.1 dephospho-CoA kinase [Comamonas sp.]
MAAATSERPFRLGLTGGIGSGKSTVGMRLAQCGAVLIDADAISRSLTAAGGAALPAIARVFGNDLIDENGALNRSRMRELVFANAQTRQQLEGILHPLIAAQTQQQYAAAVAANCKLVVHDIPLLVESVRWRQELDGVLVVDCRESTQVDRVMARNGLSADTVQSIMTAQASRAQRLAAADWVLYNDEGVTIEALDAFTDQIAAWFGL